MVARAFHRCALLVAAALLPCSAGAQPAQSFGELRRLVDVDERIAVIDIYGETTRGRLESISESSLTLTVGDESRVFTLDRVTSVRRRDSLGDGILFGVGGGLALGYALVRSQCGPPGYDDECGAIASLVFYPLGIGIGAGVGALVDGAIQKTLFRSPQNTRLTLSPVVTRDRRVVLLSVGWR